MSKLRYYAARATVAAVIASGAIMGFEGKSNKAYLDAVQVPTICYGETKDVYIGDVKTDTECERLLMLEILRIDDMITRTVRTPLKDHERAALISFIYNIGQGAFKSSTTLKRINAGDVRGGCEAIATKDYSTGVCRGYGCGYAGSKQLRGLQKRRVAERDMCLGVKK